MKRLSSQQTPQPIDKIRCITDSCNRSTVQVVLLISITASAYSSTQQVKTMLRSSSLINLCTMFSREATYNDIPKNWHIFHAHLLNIFVVLYERKEFINLSIEVNKTPNGERLLSICHSLIQSIRRETMIFLLPLNKQYL